MYISLSSKECQKLCDDEGLLCGSTAIVVCIAGKKVQSEAARKGESED